MTISAKDCFDQVRMLAARGNLVIVREDRTYLILPTLAQASVKPEMVKAIEKMIPSTTKRNVSTIADTSWAIGTSANLQIANQAIPFFGLLMGIASIGHSVWIFNGAANLLGVGCQDADVLIVDSASVGVLSSDWKIQAKQVMRNPQILVHDRASYQLRTPEP
ncbi:MAG TPA: hypothetical protein VKZ53_19225 [Candidatus Angelobacter sp.]|nr:hypothetical protein [Candidatus Angelobacter sp.]